MNGNNSWQRMGQFARSPRRDLGPVSQPPAGGLFPVGQMMEGGGIPAPAMMPQQQMPQQYGPAQPTGKKILGMPKDRFIALMGTIAQAFGGDSASGRMGEGLVSMADMMRGERMAQGEQQATEAAERRKEKRTAAAKKREKKEKIPSGWEAFYTEKKGQIDPKTKRPFTEAKIYTDFKRIGTKKPSIPKGQADFNEIDGVLHKGFWHLDTEKGEYIFAPSRIATEAEKAKTKVKPSAGEKPKEMSWAEKRARAKEKRDLESSILNPANLEDPRLQINIKAFNELPGPYVYHRTLGTPAKETGYFDLERDVPAVPSTIEKVDVSTPEKIRDSDLPVEIKLRLLKTRFGYE